MHLIVLLTLYGNPHAERIPLEGSSHRVPGIGVCATQPSGFEKSTFLQCLVPFRLPGRTVAQFDNGAPVTGLGEIPNTPYPAGFGISPINDVFWRLPNQAGSTAIIFTTTPPSAHIQREIDIPNVQLSEFAY
jgi:hypothetical protein